MIAIRLGDSSQFKPIFSYVLLTQGSKFLCQMKNLSKKSNVKNNQSFAGFTKFQLKKDQLKNIKGGSDGTGEGGDDGIVTEDIVNT